jgi:hypothetical protein
LKRQLLSQHPQSLVMCKRLCGGHLTAAPG